MINRVLIRSKIIQLVYAHCLNKGKSLEVSEKELVYSMSKGYDLYNYLLLLLPAITDYARKKIEIGKSKLQPTIEDLRPNTRFVENMLVAQLEANQQLRDFKERQKKSWDNHPEMVKALYDTIVATDVYKEYMGKETTDYASDREFWRKTYKTVICNNENLDSFFEELSLYWNDDKDIIDTFVLKTIKRFNEDTQPTDKIILPEFKDDEDRKFALSLFNRSIVNMDYYRDLISHTVKNWDIERIAFMDVVIMQVALAEILAFPSIPISVSFNEYVELAKVFSTAKSGAFVNGTLEGIVNQLKKEGKLIKSF